MSCPVPSHPVEAMVDSPCDCAEVNAGTEHIDHRRTGGGHRFAGRGDGSVRGGRMKRLRVQES